MERNSTSFRLCYHRRHKDVVTEHILTLLTVGFVLLRPLVIERTADAYASVVGLACSSIDVGHQLITQVYALQHLGEVLVFPNAAFVAFLIGSMGTEDGREHTELQPAQHQLGVCGSYL